MVQSAWIFKLAQEGVQMLSIRHSPIPPPTSKYGESVVLWFYEKCRSPWLLFTLAGVKENSEFALIGIGRRLRHT